MSTPKYKKYEDILFSDSDDDEKGIVEEGDYHKDHSKHIKQLLNVFKGTSFKVIDGDVKKQYKELDLNNGLENTFQQISAENREVISSVLQRANDQQE